MEDLDGMILATLRKLNCSFCDDVDALSLMGLNDIIEAMVRLLWACDSTNLDRLPNFKLPEQMTTRYKTATQIAKAIKELKIREEVGYQTLLYPNIYEIRQIFISLIEKLPKQAVIADDHKSPMDRLRSDIRDQIRVDLAAPKYPCYCRFLLRSKDPNKWNLKAHQPERCSFTTSTRSIDFRRRLCAALEDVETSNFNADDLTWSRTRSSTTASLNYRPMKPLIPVKPKLPPKPKARTSITESTANEKPSEDIELDRVLNENHELKLRLAELSEDLENIHFKLHSMENEAAETNSRLQKHDEKLIHILRNPEEQLPGLRSFIEQSAGRRCELEEKFNEWNAENVPRLEQLRQKRGLMVTDVVQTEMDAAIVQLKELINQQTHSLHKLQKQANRDHRSEIDHTERAKFLSRIQYLIKNINGQKREIERNYKSCKALEKERSHLNEVLDRSFTVVTKYLTSSTEQKMMCQLAYNQLIKMHSQRESIIRTWEEMLQLTQQTDELQDQIEVLKQQSVDSSLAQVLTDLERVRQENDEIRSRLQIK
ncbi:Coiled-coil domain-containing protein 22-like protein [Aphelenchoides besseyi]|nr:Coiled-coil domain-containing protein 22-like protein [Aphelenchoides besseyi]KAI6211873.1 Coiled-coil domain-containing protein 22-like protein [Aphelenchoides besseyi]